MHKEMDKADVVLQDSNENPEAPHPNEMMELEVCYYIIRSHNVVLKSTMLKIRGVVTG